MNAIAAAKFEQRDAHIRIFAETAGKDAVGRAGANDDESYESVMVSGFSGRSP